MLPHCFPIWKPEVLNIPASLGHMVAPSIGLLYSPLKFFPPYFYLCTFHSSKLLVFLHGPFLFFLFLFTFVNISENVVNLFIVLFSGICLCGFLLHAISDVLKHLALDIIATHRILLFLFPTYLSIQHLYISRTGIKLNTSLPMKTQVKKHRINSAEIA